MRLSIFEKILFQKSTNSLKIWYTLGWEILLVGWHWILLALEITWWGWVDSPGCDVRLMGEGIGTSPHTWLTPTPTFLALFGSPQNRLPPSHWVGGGWRGAGTQGPLLPLVSKLIPRRTRSGLYIARSVEGLSPPRGSMWGKSLPPNHPIANEGFGHKDYVL